MRDGIFGDMVYHNGWETIVSCDFWNIKEIKIRVSAYENEEPNIEQKNAYIRMMEDLKQISRMSYKKLREYVELIKDEIIPYCEISEIPDDICEIVSFNHVLFMESGNFAIMCDAKWDDHGVAVLCTETKMVAGPQDIVWMAEN